MAKESLAGQWLKENGLTWNATPVKKKLTRKKIKARPSPVFYCEHDRAAFIRLRKTENEGLRRQRLPPEERTPLGMDFVRANIGFDGHECLLFPHAKHGQPAAVSYAGLTEGAARAMCRLAHGEPPYPDANIARHLCGNGHISCVNPSHLEWGTAEQNSADCLLHHQRPRYFRTVEPDEVEAIRADPRHPNVIAVRFNIPSAIINLIRSGAYRP